MATLVSLAFGAGLCLLIFTGLMQLLKLGDLRALRIIRNTAPTPVGSWAAGAGRVAAEAVTEDGPAGPQTGPVSGERCAWYRITLVRRPSRSWSADVDEDVLIDVASPGPPMIGDRSGRVALDPRLFENPAPDDPPVIRTTKLVHRASAPVALPAFVTGDVLEDLRRGESLQLTEVRLPYAQRVYALALPVGAPLMLIPSTVGISIFTTGTREEVLARRRESIATARWISRGAGLTGLIVAAGSIAVLLYAF